MPYPVDCDGHTTFLDLDPPDLFTGGVTIDGGLGRLPDAPGLGVDVDWAAMDRHQNDNAAA